MFAIHVIFLTLTANRTEDKEKSTTELPLWTSNLSGASLGPPEQLSCDNQSIVITDVISKKGTSVCDLGPLSGTVGSLFQSFLILTTRVSGHIHNSLISSVQVRQTNFNSDTSEFCGTLTNA